MSDSTHAPRYTVPPAAQLPTSTGPACDECRQKKIKCDRAQPACGNCVRNGLFCEASSRVKRVNHARQLVDDVAGLNERLDNIDDTTQQLMTSMHTITELLHRARLVPHPSSPQPSKEIPTDTILANPDGYLEEETAETPDDVAAEAPNVVQSRTGHERFYGSFSTHALFYTARRIVEGVIVQVQNSQPHSIPPERPPASNPNAVKLARVLDPAALPRLIQSFNGWIPQPYDEEDLEVSAHPISLPPYSLLEESLRYYFDDACWEWPIFSKDSVYHAVQAQYAQQQSAPDIAWTLCLNNIILLFLSSRSGATDTNAALTKMVENGIVTSLVNNAKRGINVALSLMAPRLVNVQALLSIALVARDFAHYFVFEKALFLAFHVASAMGLQEEHGQRVAPVSPDSERRNVIWTIYTLDKQRCFLRGVSCLIYRFECSVNFPVHQNSGFDKYWHAQLRLSCIMEEIYRALYCPKAQKKTDQQLEASVKACSRQLSAWRSMHGSLLDIAQDSWSPRVFSAQQLRYSHYASQILVNRRGTLAENQRICLASAREALKIIQTLTQRISGGVQALVALRRIFNSCSVMAYYELWLNVLYSPNVGHTEDMTLLVDFAKALNSLASPDYPQAYCARVSKAIRWCTEMVQIIQDSKHPDSAVVQRPQFSVYGPEMQLSAWESLAPAFFSTSPYGYDFVGGDMTGVSAQMPPNIDVGSLTMNAFEPHSQQQNWTPSPSTSLATGQLNITSLSDLPSGSLDTTRMQYQPGTNASMQNHRNAEMGQDDFFSTAKTHGINWTTG